MVKLCMREGCNHNKTLHENTYDWGINSGRCTVKGCPCGDVSFGYKHD